MTGADEGEKKWGPIEIPICCVVMRDGVGGLFIFQSIVRLLFHHFRVIFKIVREYVVPYKETGGACSLKGNNDHIHDFALGKMRRGDHDLTVKNGLNLASSISLLSLSPSVSISH